MGQAVKSLFTMDRIRLTKICEIIQYAFLFAVIAIFVGKLIDRLCENLYPVKVSEETKGAKIDSIGSLMRTILVISFQVILGAIGVYYIRKIIDVIPPVVNLSSAAHPYVPHQGVSESKGEISLAIIFVGVQTSAIHQLELVRDYKGEKKD